MNISTVKQTTVKTTIETKVRIILDMKPSERDALVDILEKVIVSEIFENNLTIEEFDKLVSFMSGLSKA